MEKKGTKHDEEMKGLGTQWRKNKGFETQLKKKGFQNTFEKDLETRGGNIWISIHDEKG